MAQDRHTIEAHAPHLSLPSRQTCLIIFGSPKSGTIRGKCYSVLYFADTCTFVDYDKLILLLDLTATLQYTSLMYMYNVVADFSDVVHVKKHKHIYVFRKHNCTTAFIHSTLHACFYNVYMYTSHCSFLFTHAIYVRIVQRRKPIVARNFHCQCSSLLAMNSVKGFPTMA